MISVRSALPFLLLAASSACRSSQELAAAPPDSGSGIELFRAPAQPLHVDADLPLAELLARYTGLMGWTLEASDELRTGLAKWNCYLDRPLDIPPPGVHAFVESMLRSHGFFLEFAHAAPPVVLRVITLASKTNLPRPSVPLAEIPRWSGHPAHFIAVELPVTGADAKQLAASLHYVYSEPELIRIVQVGQDGPLEVSGPATDLANLVRLASAIGSAGPTPASQSLPSGPESTTLELLREAPGSLRLQSDAKDGPSVDALLGTYAGLMGWQLMVSPDVRELAKSYRTGLTKDVDVPPADVHAFVEGVLRSYGFVLRFAHASEPVVLEVGSIHVASAGPQPGLAPLVRGEDLAPWAKHPCFLVQTLVHLPGVDARLLADSLRGGLALQSQQLLPLGADLLLVAGYGSDVAQLAPVLGAIAEHKTGAQAASPASTTASSALALLVTPSQGLHLEKPKKGDLTLRDVLDQYAQLFGWQLLVDPDTGMELRRLRCSFTLPLDVPAERVHAFVESLANANELVFGFAHAQAPVLLRVQSLNVSGRNNPRQNALVIGAADLPQWAGHSAFLVSTIFDLPAVDVRTLSNSLRQMFSNQQTQQIIPLGTTNGLLVTGFGSEVADLATLLYGLADSAAGAHAPTPPPRAGKSVLDLLVPPAQPLRIPKVDGDVLTLQMFANVYANLMGWRVLAGPDTTNQLKTMHCDLALPLEVAPEHVHEFVQSILRANDFVLCFIHTQDPILLGISSTNVAGKGNPRKDALIVPVAELPRWAAHPDFLITTCIDLSGVDVRTLSNSMRQMFSDQQTQQIIPVGNTDGLIVTGFGSDVADIVKMLSSLSDAAAGKHSPVPEFAAKDSGIGLLAPPAKGLRLEQPQDHELKLADFFEQYVQLMGWRVLAEWDTRNQLKTLKLGLKLPLDIPPEQVHSFAESIARKNDLVLVFAHTTEPVLLQISSTNVAGRGNVRKDAMFVSAAELPRWVEHPGFLITTCIDLPGVDVRTLSNSVRQIFSDQQTQQVVPLGNSDGLILTGFASEVAALALTYGELSRSGTGLQVPALPAPPAADRARLFPLGETSLVIPAPDGKEARPSDVLVEFASWSKRPLEVSEDARKALDLAERKFAEPRVIQAQLAYLCVGLLLQRAHCTLSPMPPDAPVKWVVDVVRNPKGMMATDLPTIPFEELPAWNAYCATPFRTVLQLPAGADTRPLAGVVKLVTTGGVGGLVIVAGSRAVQLSGTPLEIQATAYAILQACEPVPDKPR